MSPRASTGAPLRCSGGMYGRRADDVPALDAQLRRAQRDAAHVDLVQPGQPEVEDLGRAVGGDDDVRRLQVAVDDAQGVRVGERARELQRDVEHLHRRGRALADARGQGRARARTP